MKKQFFLGVFLIFISSVLYSQVYGTFKTRFIVNDDSTNAKNIVQEKTSVFIEPLGVFGSHEDLGKYSFVWKSKKNSKEVVESTFNLPTAESDDFVFEWGPYNDKYDASGNRVTKFNILSGSVRTEISGKTIRYYFNAVGEDEGKKIEMRDGVFEYTLLN
ncbi:MAG: hypothetical protein J0M37_03490 [Ignavibacteria bacterium]|nr:hypothetical protein [Ignavibacteria bacterium]